MALRDKPSGSRAEWASAYPEAAEERQIFEALAAVDHDEFRKLALAWREKHPEVGIELARLQVRADRQRGIDV